MNLESLVKKAQNGDNQAFEKIYKLLASKIYKFIFYKLGNKEDSEDVSLETWTQIVKSIKKYNSSVQFNTWAYAIAKNCINKFLQEKYEHQNFISSNEFENIHKNGSESEFIEIKNDLEPTLEITSQSELIEETHIEYENKLKVIENKVAKLFKFLKPRDSKVLELRFLKGYKSEEVAKELNLSVSNVKIIQLRSIQKLKKLNFGELQ